MELNDQQTRRYNYIYDLWTKSSGTRPLPADKVDELIEFIEILRTPEPSAAPVAAVEAQRGYEWVQFDEPDKYGRRGNWRKRSDATSAGSE